MLISKICDMIDSRDYTTSTNPRKMAKNLPDFAFGDAVAHDVSFFWSSTRTQSRRTLRADLEAASSEGYEIQYPSISVEPLDHTSMHFIMNNDLNIIYHHMGWSKLWCFLISRSHDKRDLNCLGSRQNWLLHVENAKARPSHLRSFHMKSPYLKFFHSKICGDVTEVTEVRATRSVFFESGVVSFFWDFLPGLRSLEAHEGHTKLLQLHEEAGWPTSWGWWQMVSSFVQQKFHGSSNFQTEIPFEKCVN